ncbi:hypothetical protein BDV26DRAFT_274535 [Aspergillus bertholletiae]|uniref:Uncharacterized protein n=1 Tax=Aspergillus bertholletiae TaxID=1226010 RepID=A0A5N7AR93_9EURO|nr:hypothetical protein BDV26DRAFT_274535 [Aspergillus bertholletiae]
MDTLRIRRGQLGHRIPQIQIRSANAGCLLMVSFSFTLLYCLLLPRSAFGTPWHQ